MRSSSARNGTMAPSMSVKGNAVTPPDCPFCSFASSAPPSNASSGKLTSGSGMSKPPSAFSKAGGAPASGSAGGGAAPPPIATGPLLAAGALVPNKASKFSGKTTFMFEVPQYCFLKTSTPGQTVDLRSFEAAVAGAPKPRELHSKVWWLANIGAASPCARVSGMSPLKTRLRSSAIGKWLSNKPLAPPASKAAAIRRKDGSLCSSDSSVCWMMLASFFSSVFTPQMRRFFDAGPLPSSPSLSSPSKSAEFKPPRTL
mmetsp:Transcript_91195/g.263106  ORF Transcript_91195/g.263106 Transcript_91195/m.263106 type:complete len:257 (+) Transcript_91195:1633-2403(+)